jgi:hypothetical protein
VAGEVSSESTVALTMVVAKQEVYPPQNCLKMDFEHYCCFESSKQTLCDRLCWKFVNQLAAAIGYLSMPSIEGLPELSAQAPPQLANFSTFLFLR